MRRLIESLSPDVHSFYWSWVGGVFAFYVVLMVTAAGVFISHESSRKLAHEPVTTVAAGGKARSVASAATPMPQAPRNY